MIRCTRDTLLRCRALPAILVAGMLLAVSPAIQAQDAPELDDAKAELETVQSAISLSQDRVETLRAEIAALDGDRSQQNAALIAAAQRAELAEIETAAAEENLAELLAEEAQIRTRLAGEDASIASLLGTLTRISRNPPPALIVQPADALGAARAGLLLSEVLPQLKSRADAVTADLDRLVEVRAQAQTETDELKKNYASLFEEQLRIATLIAARKRGISRASADLAAEEQEAEGLAARATSLNQLIESLTARIAAVAEAAETAARQTPDSSMSDEEIRVALANTARTSPAFDFEAGKGYLARPAAGVTITDFGADDGFGAVAHGTSIVTRADAQVIAPSDGWVMYKGPYLNYGQIVILNPGQGYSILLAGLDSVDVELGQFVLMGEPIGKMGSRTIGRTVTTSAGASRPTLYIEFRKEDRPVDPAVWWQTQVEQTRSG